MKGTFTYRYYERKQLRAAGQIENFITNAGCNKLLNAMFNGISPGTNWYIGLIHRYDGLTLIDGSSPPPQPTDTLASRTLWTDFAIVGGNRPSLGQSAATGQSLNSANPVTFTLGTFDTPDPHVGVDPTPSLAWGLYITDQRSQASTTGTIMAISSFGVGPYYSEGVHVTSGGTFDVSYKLQF